MNIFISLNTLLTLSIECLPMCFISKWQGFNFSVIKIIHVHNNFKNLDNQKKKVPIAHKLTITEITGINIVVYIAWQCSYLNLCLSLFLHFKPL